MKRQSTSKLLRLMVAVFALFLLVMAGSVLSACGGTTVSELHKHTYGQPEHKDTATCGATGYDVYTCTECGDKYAIVTAATGKHTFENGVCKVCGISTVGYDDSEVQSKLQQILNAINANAGTTTKPGNAHTHDFKEDTKLNVSKTCLTFGLKVGKCECGSTAVLELIPAEGHKYSGTKELEKIAPTCTTDGQIKVTCDLCHDEFWMVDPEARALGHDFQRTTTKFDKPANCITPELRAYVCTRCGEKHYEEYDKINPERHADTMDREDKNSWVETWQKWEAPAEGTTDTTVPEALKTKPADYDYSTSTLETYYGKCEKCGQYTWKQTPVNCEHHWTALETNIPAGCEEIGKFNAKCDNCGVYANQLPSEESTDDELKFDNAEKFGKQQEENNGYVDVPATGHKYNDEDLKDFYEVDRDPDTGKVITDSNIVNPDGSKKGSNTTHWKGTVCENCHKEIVVGGEGDGKIVKYLLRTPADQKPDVDNEYYNDIKDTLFLREWHAWQLYEGKEVKVDGKALTPPADAKAPVEATCLDHGLEWYYCIDESCKQLGEGNGRWISIDLLPLGHLWGEPKVEKDPTCINGGKITYTCQRQNRDGTASRCGHSHVDGEQVTYDDKYATITFELDSTEYNKIVNGVKKTVDGVETEEWETEPFDWEYEWRTQTTADGETTNAWDPNYYTTWEKEGVWKTTCGTTTDKTNGTSTPNGSGVTDNGICGADVLKYFTGSDGKILHEVLEKFMPQAHVWVVDEAAMSRQPEQTCYDGHVTIYKCDCKMTSGSDCCTDAGTEGGKCPAWNREGKLEHVQKTDDKNNPIPNTDTFIIYGYCGTNHTSANDQLCHKNYKVTYCIYCYAIIKVEETGEENFHHFPFDRAQLFGIMMKTCPLAEGVTLKQVMENPKLLQEVATEENEEVGTYISCQEPWQKESRKLFVDAWKGIENYWFNSNGTAAENNVIKFLRLRNSHLECFDCFSDLGAFGEDEILELAKTYKDEELNWALYYYVKGENGEMIRITEDNRKTFNSCEYAYYSQYKIWKEAEDGTEEFTWYSTIRDMNKGGWADVTAGTGEITMKDIIAAIGQYTAETVDTDGKEFTPDGKHYLVPAKDYWDAKTHKNFNAAADGTVTMDWVCVFCGETFELQVKFVDTTTETASTTTEYKANVVLADEDNTRILLVDLSGVKFGDKNLNKRSGADASTIMQISGPMYAEDLIDGDTTNKNGKWTYVANGTVIITQAEGSTDIRVAHRQTDGWTWNGESSTDKDYFEGANWTVPGTHIGSMLVTKYFANAKAETEEGKALYTKIWNAAYGTAGLEKDGVDTDGKKRLEVAKRLDSLFREGGEIVVGDDLHELRKRDNKVGSGYEWDTIKPAAVAAETSVTPTDIYPLATIDRSTGGTYISSIAQGASNNSDPLYVPLLLLGDGTTIDLNGHTLYANIWVGAVDASGNDVDYAADGADHALKAGEVTIKNGNIVMSPAARIQVEGKDAHLTLDNVQVSGSADGISAFNGATITIKNSNFITKDYVISSNNCIQKDVGNLDGSAGQGSANFELENSAFISTDSTAFFMPAKGNVSAKDCEFYGYNMGVYLRGHDLEENTTAETKTHAIFENCLFAKGDQASGNLDAGEGSSGTQTKHYGAFTVGNDNAKGASYGSILKLVLRKCDFQIIHVEKIGGEEEADETAWTPGFEGEGEGKDHCDLDLGANNDNCAAHCPVEPTEEDETACTAETCCHRAIVLNIFGCSELGEGCMTEDNKCNEKCGGQNAMTGEGQPNNGRLHLVLDETTFNNLKTHAATCLHEKTQGTSATKEITNPFLGCTFTDGEALKGQCKKLLIEIEKADGTIEDAGVGFSWLEADKDKTAQANA